MWVRRAGVQPPGPGRGGPGVEPAEPLPWGDGGMGQEGVGGGRSPSTCEKQPRRSLTPHQVCSLSGRPMSVSQSSLLARYVCVPRCCVVSHEVCRCCPRVSSHLAARAPSAGALASTLHSHLITIALLTLQNMDRTVPGEKRNHHSSCVCVCVSFNWLKG